MMRSTFNDDEDDFAPNPFRDSSTTNDLFSSPMPQAQQQQQPYMQQQQQFMMQQPDPNSGMVGNLNLPMQQQQPQAMMDPSQYLSGTMDQGAALQYNPQQNSSMQQNQQQQNQQPASIFSWRGLVSCCNLDQWTKLFDVDTVDVYLRIKAAATQFHQPDYFRLTVVGDVQAQAAANTGAVSPAQSAAIPVEDRKGPDLYGPVWISMTLLFILSMTANMSDYMRHASKRKHDPAVEEFEYDLTHLLNATYVVFLYTFGLSTAFWLACQCLGMSSVSWPTWVCVYGYSQTPIVLGALVAWCLPWAIWHWLVLSMAVVASGLLIVRNLSTPLLSADVDSAHAKAAPLILSILGAHFCFLLVLKLTFYS